MSHENITHCSHRLPACRPEEGVPASIGAFLADALPEQLSSEPLLGLSFAEIPTSFYMGIRNPHLRFIVLSDLTSRSRHLRFPSDKCGVLVRTGHAKDYVHYLQEKRDHLRPRVLIGWQMFQPDIYAQEWKIISKDYTNEFGDSLFFVFHQSPDPKVNKLGYYSETLPLWTVKFSASNFERNMEQAILITTQRDEELRKIRFVDDKVEERKALRRKAAEALEAITKPIPFHLTCFYIPNFSHTGNTKATTPKFTLDPLTPESENEWTETAKECRNIIHRKLNSQGAYPSLKETSKALQEEAEARGYILDLGRIPKLPVKWNENTVELGQNLKVRQSNMAGAFLKLNDRTFEWFNSAEGRPTGVFEALLSRPNLLGRGVQEAAQVLSGLGYQLKTSPELEKRLEKKKRFYKFQESPLHELKGHELVAYYNHGKYICRNTVTNPKNKKPLWVKNREYEIIPTWAKMLYAGGSEPIVNEANSIVGMEELSVRLSYLQLKVQTETGNVVISENQCRNADDTVEAIDDLGSTPAPTPTAKKKSTATDWEPMLDEFIEAFGLPNVPTIAELKPDLLRQHVRELKQRMPDLKSYQIDCCIRNATKKGGILGGTMGSGKTRMVIGTLLLRKHMFNLVIVPPMLVDSWLEHFKLYKLHAQPLLSHDALNNLVNRYKALRGLSPEKKRQQLHADQEFYVTTPEFLTLGGIGNTVYDEWTATYESKRVVVDPITGEPVLDSRGKRQFEKIQQQVTSTRYHAKTEHTKAKIPFGTRHSYGDHIKKCPKCEAKQDHEEFTPKGWCRKCGYRAYSYKGVKQLHGRCLDGHLNPISKWIFQGRCPDCPHTEIVSLQEEKTEKISLDFINELLEGTKGAHNTVGAKVKSFNAYPAYKRIRGIFGAKAIDEVHLLANFNSQRGMAVFGIKTKETWVASGTIARGYVTDLEASLCHVHGANTPIFPFYPWGNGREGFREQFVTERVKTSVTAKEGKKKQSSSPMPEASNLNRLRRMLNCVTTTVPDSVMEKEWKLPPIKRTYEEIWLKKPNQDKYLQELTSIKSWFSGASDIERHRGALRRLWNLRLICDGEEKEARVEKYVKKWLREKRKFILTASTVAQYKRLCNILERNNVKYLAIDEKIPADRRDEATAEFADPTIQALVSRTRLVNIGLNTLIHADRLLIASLEYSPDSLRQMEKRICRPGQKSSDLQVIYPVVRMKPKSSVEEKMLKLVLEKELAVKEMLEGKVRWQSAAELLEAAKEKKGAAKVLQDIMSDDETSELDTIFSQDTEEEEDSATENNESLKESEPAPRRRGRPRKVPTAETPPAQPRKRGRPRKNATQTAPSDKPPRKRGRPRKNPTPTT